MSIRRRLPLPLALLSSLLPALPASAQDLIDPPRFWIELGAFAPRVHSSMTVDSKLTQRPGTNIDFEDDLALVNRKTLPTLLLGTRIGDNWRVEFEYFKLQRSGTKTLERDIHIGDSTYAVGASVESEFDSTVYRLSGGYSFYKNQQADFGVVLGLHVTDFTAGLTGTASFNGAPVSVRAEKRDQLAPLPTLGLFGSYAFSPSWSVAGRVDYFQVKIDEYKGRLLNLQANVRYHFNRNWSLALGYRSDDYRLEADSDDWTGDVDYRFFGPQLTLTASF